MPSCCHHRHLFCYLTSLHFLQRIRLTVVDFLLEDSANCRYDFVEIFDGPNADISTIFGRWCGNDRPGAMVLTKIKFHITNTAYVELARTHTHTQHTHTLYKHSYTCTHVLLHTVLSNLTFENLL